MEPITGRPSRPTPLTVDFSPPATARSSRAPPLLLDFSPPATDRPSRGASLSVDTAKAMESRRPTRPSLSSSPNSKAKGRPSSLTRKSVFMPPLPTRRQTSWSENRKSRADVGQVPTSFVAVAAAARLKQGVRSRREGPYGTGQAPVPDRPLRPGLQRLATEVWREEDDKVSELPSPGGSPRGAIHERVKFQKRATTRGSMLSSPRGSATGSSSPRTPALQGVQEDGSPNASRKVRGSGIVYSSVFPVKSGFDAADIEAILADTPLFSACSQQLLSSLADCCHVREVGIREDILVKGDTATGLVIILRGLATVYMDTAQCTRVPRGGCFGETHLLGLEQYWSCTLRSEVACTVGELSREDFLQACEPYADVSKWFESIKKGGICFSGEGITTNTCELFEGLSPEALLGIEHSALTHLYFPGEVMVGQGDRSEECCILMQGRATVQVAGRSVREIDRARAKTPLCFGEPGLFGLRSPQGTCVLARSVCLVRIIYRSVFLASMQDHGEYLTNMHVSKLLQACGRSTSRSKMGEGASFPLFQDIACSSAFLHFITDNLEGRIFLSGQTILDEAASPERCMVSLLFGVATLTKGGKEVSTLRTGMSYGELVLLGLDTERAAALVARETSHVEVLHQGVLVVAMGQHPEDREKVLARALKRSKETRTDGTPSYQVPGECTGALLTEFLKAPFFEGMTLECLQQISSVAQTQLFLPGEFITEQGVHGESSMFIMVTGSASVILHSGVDDQGTMSSTPFKQAGRIIEKMQTTKVQDLKLGSVFGELAMLGIMPARAATVQAEALCSLWEVHQAPMMTIVKEFPDAQRKLSSIVCGSLESSVPARVHSLPIFADFDQSFQMLLSLYCERRVYFPGERLAHGGRAGDGLYVMNVGQADFERSGVRVMRLVPGSHFGSTIMLGIHKFFLGTVEALAVCHVLVVTRESYLMALERYPAPAAAQALKKSEAKSAEDLQSRMRRTVLKEQVMISCEEALREKLGRRSHGRKSSDRGKPDTETVLEVFTAWQTYVQARCAHRRKERRQAGRWSWWVSGRQVAMQQRMQIERQAMVDAHWREEPLPGSEDVDLTFLGGGELPPRSPRWANPLAPYALDQAACRRPRRASPRNLETVEPDFQRILQVLDGRRVEAAALAAARAKVPDGPDIGLLGAAARAAAAVAAETGTGL